MKKGVKSIRQKERKKDNLEKFPTFFFFKKNTTGILLSMLVMKWLCRLSAREYTPGFEMCTMGGKLCLPSGWRPTFTAPIIETVEPTCCHSCQIPSSSVAQYLTPGQCTFQNQIFEKLSLMDMSAAHPP